MSLTADLQKLKKRSPSQRSLLIEAYLVVLCVSIAIKYSSLNTIRRRLSIKEGSSEFNEFRPDQLKTINEIGEAVTAAAGRLRMNSKNDEIRGACLAQGISAMVLLRRQNIQCHLILGVASDKSAHAWLQCGDVTVTGKNGMERYTPVATFTW